MPELDDLLTWLRAECGRYEVEPVAVYRRRGDHPWPLVAQDADDLTRQLEAGGHFLPLPKEPAALANVVEVSITDFLTKSVERRDDISLRRGTERGYPDTEVSGPAFGEKFFAVDIKVARRKTNSSGRVNSRKTQSRITLYTGNTYFRWPDLHWPGTFRPFEEYHAHLDIVAIYTLDEESTSRIADLELIVHETWRLAPKKREAPVARCPARGAFPRRARPLHAARKDVEVAHHRQLPVHAAAGEHPVVGAEIDSTGAGLGRRGGEEGERGHQRGGGEE